MLIQFIEIRNFRKLESVRIDFAEETTLLVGANNSGKTSAMIALSRFLVDPSGINTNDFTLSHWKVINQIGTSWESKSSTAETRTNELTPWEAVLPSVDVWLSVSNNELHYVRDMLPTLEWSGGTIGVRLRYEPRELEQLKKDYLKARSAASRARQEAAKPTDGSEYTVTLWPGDLRQFLDRRLNSHFSLRTYLLDPSKTLRPENGIALPQSLPLDSEPLDSNPLRKLIRVDEIHAHRAMGQGTPSSSPSPQSIGLGSPKRGWLSDQLRTYYARHLDPSESPEAADLAAIQAIESAQAAFDSRLEAGFEGALAELQQLNYPGITDPKLKIATRLRPTDGLAHDAAVQYSVIDDDGHGPLRLPEDYNGLGYQNLISMVFRLMSFRDSWMRVGKAGGSSASENSKDLFFPPLHLVLVEEPEAHLHCQVQQVFVRQAYKVLRNDPHLKSDKHLRTQLIVSTHSSHIAHEVDFSSLRYFRRRPPANQGAAPISAVINLSEVFGEVDETRRFVARYLRTTHADLFFADAAIIVEGSAERLLVPHFVRKHFPILDRCYISVLEINGSHAHQLRPLIEHLGILTLIITDIDAGEANGKHKKTPPKRDRGQITNNSTLKNWHPEIQEIDNLLNLSESGMVKHYAKEGFFVRVAYQSPFMHVSKEGKQTEILTYTLEDTLILANCDLFQGLNRKGPLGRVCTILKHTSDISLVSAQVFNLLDSLEKAQFALEVLWHCDPEKLVVPDYIYKGLSWLQSHLKNTTLTPKSKPDILGDTDAIT